MPIEKNVAKKKIIVALDVGTSEEAGALVEKLSETDLFKVGLQLFTAEGPSLLKKLKKLGKNIFLDLKLHDIPNTVAGAIRSAINHGVSLMTLHASGGSEMMARAASEAANAAEIAGKTRPLLMAVTILTSLKENNLREIGMTAELSQQVRKLAKLAKDSKMDGVVCSPWEIEIIREEVSDDFLVVTPGIRPAWSASNDQKRIMTPLQAIEKGADYLVIGRPVIAAPDPRAAFQKIVEEIAS